MEYKLKITNWETDSVALSDIRRKVFIEEQKVPEELEWDEYDKNCTHILVTDKGKPVATGRLKGDGHIGRMAVLKGYRNKGIGTGMIKELINISIEKKLKKIYLHAQITAISFYEKHGFKTYSDQFMDAGIPHKSMILNF